MLSRFFSAPLVRVGVRYGGIGAVLCMVFVISLYYMDRHPFLISPFLDSRIPVFGVMLFFFLKEVRDYHYSGTLYFWQGMVGGLLFTFVCASLCWSFIVAFAGLVPDFVSSFVATATEQAMLFTTEDIERIGRETFEQSLVELKRSDRYFMASRYFFQSFIIGFFVSVVVSVVVRKTPQRESL